MDYYVVYPVLTAVPLWLICATANRVRRHYRDGFDRPIRKPKHYYVKRICTLLMFLITLIHVGEVTALQIQDRLTKTAAVFIGLYLGVSALAWLVSFSMLSFEFRLKLQMRWGGHRGFWLVSSALYLAVMISFFVDNTQESDLYFITYLFGSLISLGLALFAVFRPSLQTIGTSAYHRWVLHAAPQLYAACNQQTKANIAQPAQGFCCKPPHVVNDAASKQRQNGANDERARQVRFAFMVGVNSHACNDRAFRHGKKRKKPLVAVPVV